MDIENKYYNAKQMKATNPEEAIEEFLGVPGLEQEKGDWFVLPSILKVYQLGCLFDLALKGL